MVSPVTPVPCVGLPRHVALTLVAQTALGAARMVLDSGRHPAALRDDVTTPAGCTIAGLLMLEDGRVRSVLARAVEEATKTAAHLGASTAKISENTASHRAAAAASRTLDREARRFYWPQKRW